MKSTKAIETYKIIKNIKKRHVFKEAALQIIAFNNAKHIKPENDKIKTIEEILETYYSPNYQRMVQEVKNAMKNWELFIKADNNLLK